MQFIAKHCQIQSVKTSCLIVGVYEGGKLTPSAQIIDKHSKHTLTRYLKREQFQGKVADSTLLYDLPNISTQRILVMGYGKVNELTDQLFRKLTYKAAAQLIAANIEEAISFLLEVDLKQRDNYWKIRQNIECIADATYRFTEFKTNNSHPVKLKKIIFSVDDKRDLAQADIAIAHGNAINHAMALTKTLGNLPPNVCTPSYLAKQAQALAKQYKTLKAEIMEEPALKKMGMGALLAVAQGSREAVKLITLRYEGAGKKQNPIVFVGKGITFDSGGISLKPGAGMDEMKYDMCGAATVLGLLQAAAELKLPLNVIGVIPAAENMPSGHATRPGDIVKTMAGQTIEILNTDAEGRLILCDALTYSAKFNPDTVIDIATLTGAMIIALGNQASGLFSNQQKLADELKIASELSGDRIWQMPMWEEYGESLASNFADMANIGGREAGSIIAASFLSRFTKKLNWAHLDIAGTAWKSGKEKCATGRPIPLLVQFLLNRC